MGNYYARKAGVELRAKLEELSAQPMSQTMSLKDEVEFARVLAARAVTMYDVVVEQGKLDIKKEDGTVEMNHKARMAAMSVTRDTISFLSELVEKMTKVEMAKKDKISVHNIIFITEQICRTLYEEIGPNNQELAERCVKRILAIRALHEDESHPKVVLNIDAGPSEIINVG